MALGMTRLALLVAMFVTYVPTLTHAHGRMLDPPSRMSAWRFGYNVPTNYNDNEQYCGGFMNQWKVNQGKCGICGDPWQGPRHYERPNGSKVPNLVITRTYEARSTIDVKIEVTANHLGWFEFRLCDVRASGGVEATQACLDKHVIADRRGKTRFDIGRKVGIIKFLLVLPPGLTCPHCVMQWKWHCGNNVGYGERQEEFYACSDVTIKASGTTYPVITNPPVIITRPPVIVTRPPVIITRPPPIITQPPVIVTNPPIYVTPTRKVTTRQPLVTLPPDLLAKLGNMSRPLADRIQDYTNYQKTQYEGYQVWEANKLTYRPRAGSNWKTGIINSNNNPSGYNGVGNNYNNNYYGNLNNNNNNNNNNSNNNNSNSNNNNSNSYFCRMCGVRCLYPDCTKQCPQQCPSGVNNYHSRFN